MAIISSPIKNLVNSLKGTIQRQTDSDMETLAITNEIQITDWLKKDNNLQLLTEFLEYADMQTWKSREEHRGNISRYRVLREYYRLLFK